MADRSDDFRHKIDPSHDDYEIEEWPFYHMARLISLYHLKMDNALKPIGMDVPRWRVLNILAKNEVATITEIASEAVIRMPTMAKIIQRMTSEGLVTTRTAASDGRSTEVLLTGEGRKKLDHAKVKAGVIGRQAFLEIDDEDVKSLNDVSRRIYGNLSP